MIIHPNNHPSNLHRGYTLLFAVLTAALVLGIAVFIVTTTAKQYELSAAAKNSMYSFYAADGAVECAAGAFVDGDIDVSGVASISCNGTTISGISFVNSTSGYPPVLVSNIKQTPAGSFKFDTGNGTCADIIIYDGFSSELDPYGDPYHYTFIDSRGYNKCTSIFGPDTTNSATVERVLRLGKKG